MIAVWIVPTKSFALSSDGFIVQFQNAYDFAKWVMKPANYKFIKRIEYLMEVSR